MLLPTLPDLYLQQQLSIVVEFLFCFIVKVVKKTLYIPMQCKLSDRKYLRQY